MSETDPILPPPSDPPAAEDIKPLADTQPIGDPLPQDASSTKPPMSETDPILPPPSDPPAAEDIKPLADTQPIGDPLPQDASSTKPAKAPKPRYIAGLVLVDVPAHGIKCGDYVTLPAATAKGLQASGEFDPQAPRPE